MRGPNSLGGESTRSQLGRPDGADQYEMGSIEDFMDHAFRCQWSIHTQFPEARTLQNSDRMPDSRSLRSRHTLSLEQNDDDPESRRWSQSSSSRRAKITGWRAGAVTCTCTAAFVLLLNTVFTIWGTQALPMQGGFGTLIEGNCSKVKRWGSWLHVVINALSTLLLGASNYCMQYLTSPTREEVDEAHAGGRWLDIGIPSVRNLRRISWSRIILWSLLGLSSVPLHLM